MVAVSKKENLNDTSMLIKCVCVRYAELRFSFYCSLLEGQSAAFSLNLDEFFVSFH